MRTREGFYGAQVRKGDGLARLRTGHQVNGRLQRGSSRGPEKGQVKHWSAAGHLNVFFFFFPVPPHLNAAATPLYHHHPCRHNIITTITTSQHNTPHHNLLCLTAILWPPFPSGRSRSSLIPSGACAACCEPGGGRSAGRVSGNICTIPPFRKYQLILHRQCLSQVAVAVTLIHSEKICGKNCHSNSRI
ncbi:hypothetical protein E2C01_031149 [Portunus trituberculatus]|uniref:Uncharacterized protein n=1 Tax=Portunus trituberculatus TaxID=210409 RepID=A0A5B7ETQ8_PORTR|nr:hypothetical protein [Portunus trituberculatus]